MTRFAPALAALGLAFAAGPLVAQTAAEAPPSAGHEAGHEAMATPVPAHATPSTRAYIEAMDRMHADMAIDYSGDADEDFVRGMIPHHQGAIDMARIVLEHGDDPAIREMAGKVIAAQEAEIAAMQDWLAANGR